MADSRAQGEAKRRSAKSGSRTTGKSVAQSHASLEFAAPLGAGGQLKFKFDGPPQLDDARVYELARLQMMGFFYFLTYDRSRNVGHYWPGDFFPIHGTIKSDWGNALHRAFMKETGGWNYRIVLNTASGYYRAMIRRYPKADCWAWAVEWNDCYRLVGFFGDQTPAKAVADELPSVPVLSMREPNGGVIRYRVEESLRDEEDTLFRMPLEAED